MANNTLTNSIVLVMFTWIFFDWVWVVPSLLFDWVWLIHDAVPLSYNWFSYWHTLPWLDLGGTACCGRTVLVLGLSGIECRPTAGRLGLGGTGCCPAVGCHHACLTSNGDQNTPIRQDDNQEYENIEGQNVPDPVCHSSLLALPEKSREAFAVHQATGINTYCGSDDRAADPCKCYWQVYSPVVIWQKAASLPPHRSMQRVY